MKVTIELSTWYAKGNPWNPFASDLVGQHYFPKLLDADGLKCCLGFATLSHKPECDIYGRTEPKEVAYDLSSTDWMVSSTLLAEFTNSDLAVLAMDINDGSYGWMPQPFTIRMGNLITVFLEGGDELEFV